MLWNCYGLASPSYKLAFNCSDWPADSTLWARVCRSEYIDASVLTFLSYLPICPAILSALFSVNIWRLLVSTSFLMRSTLNTSGITRPRAAALRLSVWATLINTLWTSLPKMESLRLICRASDACYPLWKPIRQYSSFHSACEARSASNALCWLVLEQCGSLLCSLITFEFWAINMESDSMIWTIQFYCLNNCSQLSVKTSCLGYATHPQVWPEAADRYESPTKY